MQEVEKTMCPAGIAKGAHHLATRGTGIMVTYWPDRTNQLPTPPWNHIRGVPFWNQEMTVWMREIQPELNANASLLAAREHWAKLWAAIEAIPEEQAIEHDIPRGKFKATERSWAKPKPSIYRSPFCTNSECLYCKQIDCDCPCHAQETTVLAR